MDFALRWHFGIFASGGFDLRIRPKAYRKLKDNFAIVLIVFA